MRVFAYCIAVAANKVQLAAPIGLRGHGEAKSKRGRAQHFAAAAAGGRAEDTDPVIVVRSGW